MTIKETSGHVIKRYPGREYAIIPNTTLEDTNIKDSLSLLSYLVGKPENWIVRFEDLTRRFGWKKHKIYRLLKELEVAGYLRREFLRDSGGHVTGVLHQIANEAIFDYEPLPNYHNNKNNQAPPDNQPHPDFQEAGKQQAGNQGAYKTNKNTTKKEFYKNTDLDLRNSDHKSQSGNCIKTDKKSPLPNPLNSRELKTQPTKTSPEAITATQPSTPKKDTSKVEIAAAKHLQVANLAKFNDRVSPKKPKTYVDDKMPWDKLPTDIHDAPIEERLDFINLSKAKIDGKSFTPKELVARYGKDKLAMVWSDMKGFVAENPGKHVLNVAGLFLKRLRSTEAMLGSAPTQSA